MYMVQCNKFISFFFEITIKLPFILHLPFLAVEQKKLRSLSQFFTVCWYVLNLGSRFLDFFTSRAAAGLIEVWVQGKKGTTFAFGVIVLLQRFLLLLFQVALTLLVILISSYKKIEQFNFSII